MSTSANRPKTSPIWLYAANLTATGAAPQNSSGKQIWRCKVCLEQGKLHPKEFILTGGTRAPAKHLREDHGLSISSSRDAKRAHDAENSRKIYDVGGFKRHCRNALKALGGVNTSHMHAGVLRTHFIEWIARDNLPASTTSSPAFRAFLEYVNPLANRMLPRSTSTLRSDLEWSVSIRLPTTCYARRYSKGHTSAEIVA